MRKEGLIRVLIADDHLVVREGLTAILQMQPDMTVVGEASDGREAIDLFRQHRPDVTLMDLRMPEVDGITAISEIRADYPNARIILLTTYEGDEDVYRGVRAGARAYLLKAGPRDELLETIRAVHEGRTHFPVDIATKLAERLHAPELTAREHEVLEMLVEGKSNMQIGQAL